MSYLPVWMEPAQLSPSDKNYSLESNVRLLFMQTWFKKKKKRYIEPVRQKFARSQKTKEVDVFYCAIF